MSLFKKSLHGRLGVIALALSVVVLASSCFSIQVQQGVTATHRALTYPAGYTTDWMFVGSSQANADNVAQTMSDAGSVNHIKIGAQVCFPAVPAGAYPRAYIAYDPGGPVLWPYKTAYTYDAGCSAVLPIIEKNDILLVNLASRYAFAVALPGETLSVGLVWMDKTIFSYFPVGMQIDLGVAVSTADESHVWYNF